MQLFLFIVVAIGLALRPGIDEPLSQQGTCLVGVSNFGEDFSPSDDLEVEDTELYFSGDVFFHPYVRLNMRLVCLPIDQRLVDQLHSLFSRPPPAVC